MGMVEFSEPAAAAKAVRAWHNKRPYPKGKRLKVALWNKRPPNRRDSFGSRERSAELEELRMRVEAAERRAEAAEAARARACVAASELTALRGRNGKRCARAEAAGGGVRRGDGARGRAGAPGRARRGERGGRDGGARANADLPGHGGGARGSPGADERHPDARPGRLRASPACPVSPVDLLGEVRHLPQDADPFTAFSGGRARERRRAEILPSRQRPPVEYALS